MRKKLRFGKLQMDAARNEKQNNLRAPFLKIKIKIFRKFQVLLTSFDSNFICNIIVLLKSICIYMCCRFIKEFCYRDKTVPKSTALVLLKNSIRVNSRFFVTAEILCFPFFFQVSGIKFSLHW